jgi:Ca2+-binding RTX toxin-like protein
MNSVFDWASEYQMKKAKWTGTQFDDVYTAKVNQTILNGLAGNDELYASVAGTKMFGGDGNDSLFGNSGKDSIFGGYGDDRLMGNSGDDFLFGEDGEDVIDGGLGNDAIDGGALNDVLDGQGGIDVLSGGFGDDPLYGGSGNDVLQGGFGADLLVGGSGADNFIIERDPTYTGDQTDTIGQGYAPGLDRFEVGYDKIILFNIPGLSDIDDVSIRLVSDTYINPATGNPVFTVHNQILFNGVVLADVWTDRLTMSDIYLQ